MYNPVPFSPSTTLIVAVNAVETRLYFDDVSVFGPAPNLITLRPNQGVGETVLMQSVGSNFIDVQRNVEGTAQPWPIGTLAARFFTAKDQRDTQSNVLEVQGNLSTHAGRIDNPHAVTKAQVGLGNVDNTSDANKPISTAVATALAGKAATVHTHAQADVTGLGTALTGLQTSINTAQTTADNAQTAADNAAAKAGVIVSLHTLRAIDWVDTSSPQDGSGPWEQTLSVPSITAAGQPIAIYQNTATATPEQRQAYAWLALWTVSQDVGTITVAVGPEELGGVKPNIDIPIVIEATKTWVVV